MHFCYGYMLFAHMNTVPLYGLPFLNKVPVTMIPAWEMFVPSYMYIIIIIIIICIQPLDQSGQRPEFSQATGMALVCFILGKFLGVACHCFPPVCTYTPLI